MNIFAYTENEPAPAYISINSNNGDIPVVSVRSRSQGGVSYVDLPDAQVRALRDALTIYLDKADQDKGIAPAGGADAAALPLKVTPAMIEAKIMHEHYEVLSDGRTTLCHLTLANGTTERGESTCALACEFDAEKGRKYAREDAVRKVWPKEGYLLREDHYRAGSPLV